MKNSANMQFIDRACSHTVALFEIRTIDGRNRLASIAIVFTECSLKFFTSIIFVPGGKKRRAVSSLEGNKIVLDECASWTLGGLRAIGFQLWYTERISLKKLK